MAEQSTALAVREEPKQQSALQVYEPQNVREAMDLAKVLVASKLLPRSVQTPEAAFTIILTGKELGLTAMQSLRTIHVIEGKPSLSADLMLALVKSSPKCRFFRMVESTPEVATYETDRHGEGTTRLSFTMDEAKAASLTGKDNWKKYPAAMLRARCIAALARAVYPDLVMGVYEEDELTPAAPPRVVGSSSTPRAVEVQAAPAQEPAPEQPPLVTELLAQIEAAQDTESLDAVASQIGAAFNERRLPESWRAALRKPWVAKQAALQGKAA